MLRYVFSIRDVATDAYFDPFCSPTKPAALRTFADLVNDPQSTINRHPEDYELFELGSFDTGSGMFEVGVPRSVATGKAVYRGPSVQEVQDARGREAAERLNGRS